MGDEPCGLENSVATLLQFLGHLQQGGGFAASCRSGEPHRIAFGDHIECSPDCTFKQNQRPHPHPLVVGRAHTSSTCMWE